MIFAVCAEHLCQRLNQQLAVKLHIRLVNPKRLHLLTHGISFKKSKNFVEH